MMRDCVCAQEERILRMGGYVSPASPQMGPPRVWIRKGEGPGLAMARSIGDHICRQAGVIATPEVQRFDMAPGTEYRLCLASDGVWEFIENDKAMQVVMSHPEAGEACLALIDKSSRHWKEEEGTYRDDITAIVAHLPFFPTVTTDDSAATSELTSPTSAASDKATNGTYAVEPRSRRGSDIEAKGEGHEHDHSFLKRRLTINTDMTEVSVEAQRMADLRAKFGQ